MKQLACGIAPGPLRPAPHLPPSCRRCRPSAAACLRPLLQAPALLQPPPPAPHFQSPVQQVGPSKLEVLQLPGMETALTLGSADQQLGLRFKKLFLNDSDVGLKVRAMGCPHS